VETTSFKGAVVTGVTHARTCSSLTSLRELLENAAARTAAESMADADRDRLDASAGRAQAQEEP
jgi:DNA-binding GntR family transcriptional regulator